jgi:hypothetical protein
MNFKIGLIVLALCASVAQADEVTVAGGTTWLNGRAELFAVTYTHPIEHKLKLETTLMYIGESTQWDRDQPAKWVLMQRVSKKFGPVEIAFGGSYATKVDDFNGSRLNFSESLRYRFDEHWSFEIMHISNAGFKKPNLGRDILLASYKW